MTDGKKKPKGYWHIWDNLEREIRNKFGTMIDRGIFPTQSMLAAANISNNHMQKFGYMTGVAKKLNCNLVSCWKCRDKHMVRSSYEIILDEYLYSIGVPHEPDVRICNDYSYRCDQKIGDIYIEIFGYPKNKECRIAKQYNETRAIKEELYKTKKLKLISIEYKVFCQSYSKIEKHLDELFLSLGFDINKKSEFDILLLLQMAGCVLTEDEIIKQLQEVIEEIGRFPTHEDLINLDKSLLSNLIGKSNGIHHYRDKLGFEQIRVPNDYWNEETILNAIKDCGFKTFPSDKELQGINRGELISAIRRNGGTYSLAKKFQELGYGEAGNNRLNIIYCDEETILDAVKKCGFTRFPSSKELININRSDLSSAISKNGGFILLGKRFNELGYGEASRRSKLHSWDEDTIFNEIKKLGFNCFPTCKELTNINEWSLKNAIAKNGGTRLLAKKFQELGYGETGKRKHKEWCEDGIFNTIKECGFDHFPNHGELKKINRWDLLCAISNNGGFYELSKKFHQLGYGEIGLRKNKCNWTEDTIFEAIKTCGFGYFPTFNELRKIKRGDLINAISVNGGIRYLTKKFKELGYGEIGIRKTKRIWNEKTILESVKNCGFNHFPTSGELKKINRVDLIVAINRNGGFYHLANRFHELGYGEIGKRKSKPKSKSKSKST